ncbi:MAG: S-layer homology domain-containing protein [Candidatus Tectomicrobia bacterium]|uniref:S-layer homology domain-containing protein n=1 Tax=Tectimicrobiota bacterium TaxID=2528274 RepID=A0A932GPD3_UNCTE|nr:S-layer homology domain-containing protein [Candidatus Tectomicrobia bacterium]
METPAPPPSPSLSQRFPQIARSSGVTRAEAATVIVRGIPRFHLIRPLKSVEIVTDIPDHSARREILEVVGKGIMEVYPNHTFSPSSLLSRGELAEILSTLIDRLPANRRPPLPGSSSSLRFQDLLDRNRYAPAVYRMVRLGILKPKSARTFGVGEKVSGGELLGAVSALNAWFTTASRTSSDTR